MFDTQNKKCSGMELLPPILHSPLSTLHLRKGFTLVELLTVIVIITLLAGISLFALTGSYEEAKIVKTRGTIQKLDAAIQTIFEGYEEKYDAMSPSSAQVNAITTSSSTAAQRADAKATLKLHFIRDTMRMEMPQNWNEVCSTASSATPRTKLGPIPCVPLGGTSGPVVDEPAAFGYYYTAYSDYVGTDSTKVKGPNTAALLYLIIANLNPEALEGFGGSEIADTDGDGLLEFVDAWGRPIEFLRWAPGFTGGDKQPDIVSAAGGATSVTWGKGPNGVAQHDWDNPPNDLIVAFEAAHTSHSDPFDQNSRQRGWFLYPLIYSAGPDGVFNIYTSTGTPTSPAVSTAAASLGTLDPFEHPWGLPNDVNGGHHDNIHNHRQSGGF